MKGAELFEFFKLLEGGGGGVDECFEKGALVAVDADVAPVGVGGAVGLGLTKVGDGGAGEVEGGAGLIKEGFDDGGVVHFIPIADGGDGGDHLPLGVLEGMRELVDEGGIDERFVALDVDAGVGGNGLDGFGDAVGAGGVVGVGHDDIDMGEVE